MKKSNISRDSDVIQIPYIAHESEVYRLKRCNHKLWVALVISLLCVLVMGIIVLTKC
jgi:hypothetical protein